jgi:predicted nuclease with TOPRIM domain
MESWTAILGGEKSMRETIEQRLDLLKKEFEKGQTKLRDVQLQQSKLHETLLRISGAIQVLEELLAEDEQVEQADVRSIEARSVCSATT